MPNTQRRNSHSVKAARLARRENNLHDPDAPENLQAAFDCFGLALSFLCRRMEGAQARDSHCDNHETRNANRKDSCFPSLQNQPQGAIR